MNSIKINDKILTEDSPTYFVADIASNHDGSLARAKELIRLAANAGADAAKFQNFKADKIVSRNGFNNLGEQLSHQKSWKKSVYEIYEDASVPGDWTAELYEECRKFGIDYATSPYDYASISLVEPYTSFFKIGSGDITWPEIGIKMAETGKPVFFATGASSLDDVKRMMSALLNHTRSIVLMQCNTNYTGQTGNYKYINLNVLKTFKNLWPNIMTGLSDHSPGHVAVLGAVALGVKVIEKHFTDSNTRSGPDHAFSLTPEEWAKMVIDTRTLEQAMGNGIKCVEDNEKETVIIQRRSLYATKNLEAGYVLSCEDLTPLRPAPEDGIPPYMLKFVIGKKLVKSISAGEMLARSHLE